MISAYLMMIRKIYRLDNKYKGLVIEEFSSFVSNSLLGIHNDIDVVNETLTQINDIVFNHSVDYLEACDE